MISIFQKRLKEELRYSGLSRKQLANLIGISPKLISQYCTTGKLPKLDTFTSICRALDVSADYMLGLDEH